MLSLLKELATAAGAAAVKALVKLIGRAPSDGWVDVALSEPPPQPLSHKDVERQQAQIRSATEPHDPALCDLCADGKCSGRGPPVDRRATTVRPGRPKPGTLPR